MYSKKYLVLTIILAFAGIRPATPADAATQDSNRCCALIKKITKDIGKVSQLLDKKDPLAIGEIDGLLTNIVATSEDVSFTIVTARGAFTECCGFLQDLASQASTYMMTTSSFAKLPPSAKATEKILAFYASAGPQVKAFECRLSLILHVCPTASRPAGEARAEAWALSEVAKALDNFLPAALKAQYLAKRGDGDFGSLTDEVRAAFSHISNLIAWPSIPGDQQEKLHKVVYNGWALTLGHARAVLAKSRRPPIDEGILQLFRLTIDCLQEIRSALQAAALEPSAACPTSFPAPHTTAEPDFSFTPPSASLATASNAAPWSLEQFHMLAKQIAIHVEETEELLQEDLAFDEKIAELLNLFEEIRKGSELAAPLARSSKMPAALMLPGLANMYWLLRSLHTKTIPLYVEEYRKTLRLPQEDKQLKIKNLSRKLPQQLRPIRQQITDYFHALASAGSVEPAKQETDAYIRQASCAEAPQTSRNQIQPDIIRQVLSEINMAAECFSSAAERAEKMVSAGLDSPDNNFKNLMPTLREALTHMSSATKRAKDHLPPLAQTPSLGRLKELEIRLNRTIVDLDHNFASVEACGGIVRVAEATKNDFYDTASDLAKIHSDLLKIWRPEIQRLCFYRKKYRISRRAQLLDYSPFRDGRDCNCGKCEN